MFIGSHGVPFNIANYLIKRQSERHRIIGVINTIIKSRENSNNFIREVYTINNNMMVIKTLVNSTKVDNAMVCFFVVNIPYSISVSKLRNLEAYSRPSQMSVVELIS